MRTRVIKSMLLLLATMPVCPQQRLTFDAASVKPSAPDLLSRNPGGGPGLKLANGRVSGRNVTTRKMIMDAYHLTEQQVLGGPAWLDSDRYDIEAKSEGPATADQAREMLQVLLAERFKLESHHLNKEIPVYALTVSKRGSQLSEIGGPPPKTPTRPEGAKIISSYYDRGTLPHFVEYLSKDRAIDRPILDKTGLTGSYAFTLQQYSGEDIFATLESQMGLKLESQRALMPILVIDRVERPTAN